MRRFTSLLILMTFMMTFPSISRAASWWWDNTLVTIDGTSYTKEDFTRWWRYWNDTNLALPETPEPYVDWLLLVREGKRMELDSAPSFQNKTRIFLLVRSLLLLKKEEIDGRINISEDDIRARYDTLYTPIWLLQRLEFKDEASAQNAWKELNEGRLTIDELIKLPQEEGGPINQREDWRRPVGIDPEWAEIFKKLSVGQASEPVAYDEHFVSYYLKTKEDGDPEDYSKVREMLRKKLWKDQEAALSSELIAKLRRKFEVQVDDERLASLSLTAPDESYTDATIIATNRQNFSEKDFITIARQQLQSGQHPPRNQEEEEGFKTQVVNGIISQNMTNWEALDRNYQEREPLMWEYQFNINHRLTLAVEERLFLPEATVTEAEIQDYYKENISRFSQPEIVRLVIITDADGSVDRIWGDMAAGKSFSDAVREHSEQKDSPTEFPFEHLDPPVQELLNGLVKGETSQPFEYQDRRVLIHLVDRIPAKALPLKLVEANIRSMLKTQKLEQKRKEYLDLLKSRSKIELNGSNWKAVQKELGGTK
jgi:parvulin-like peptidyl-prolyl isomerase